MAGGGVEVLWADGSRSTAQPAQLFVVSGDDDMGGPVGTASMSTIKSHNTTEQCAHGQCWVTES